MAGGRYSGSLFRRYRAIWLRPRTKGRLYLPTQTRVSMDETSFFLVDHKGIDLAGFLNLASLRVLNVA